VLPKKQNASDMLALRRTHRIIYKTIYYNTLPVIKKICGASRAV